MKINNFVQTKIKPDENDVLCGLRKEVYNHPGNQYYRDLIRNDKEKYAAASCVHFKKEIAKLIINKVHTLNPPGRFLKYNKNDNMWYDIGAYNTLKKVQQALREGQHKLKRKMEDAYDNNDAHQELRSSCLSTIGVDMKINDKVSPIHIEDDSILLCYDEIETFFFDEDLGSVKVQNSISCTRPPKKAKWSEEKMQICDGEIVSLNPLDLCVNDSPNTDFLVKANCKTETSIMTEEEVKYLNLLLDVDTYSINSSN